jgi:membrane protease subunit HflK
MTTPAHAQPPTAPAEDPGAQALGDALRSGLRVLRFVMLLVLGVVLFSGVFTVEPNEVAMVLRFGKPVGIGTEQLLKPGLHWAFPYPIDEIVRIPVGQSHSLASSIGWYKTTPEQDAAGQEPPARGSLVPGVDGYTIAADGNIIHARATLKYRIADPARYAFRFTSASNLLQNVLNNALLDASAQLMADAAIYRDKLGFKDAVLARLRDGIEQHQLGITLDPFDVQVVAPLDVRPAFEAVLAAEQERSRKINEARGYANEVTLKAGGEAEAVISVGRSASNRLVSAVSAEANYFTEQLPHYERNPALFSRRRLAETVELVMTNAQDKFLFPVRPDGEPRNLRLQLSREPARLTPRETSKP